MGGQGRIVRALTLVGALLAGLVATAASAQEDHSYYGPRLVEEKVRIPTPNGRVANLTFGGAKFDTIYATCGDRVYSRKVKVQGANAFQPPIKPAPGFFLRERAQPGLVPVSPLGTTREIDPRWRLPRYSRKAPSLARACP